MLLKVSFGGMKENLLFFSAEPQTFQIYIFCGSQDMSIYLTDR